MSVEGAKTIEKMFGRQLRAARKARGFTQETLAEALSLSKTTIYNMEAGEQFVSGDVLRKLIPLLGEPPSFYFSDERPNIPPAAPTPAIEALLKTIEDQQREIRALKARIAELEQLLAKPAAEVQRVEPPMLLPPLSPELARIAAALPKVPPKARQQIQDLLAAVEMIVEDELGQEGPKTGPGLHKRR